MGSVTLVHAHTHAHTCVVERERLRPERHRYDTKISRIPHTVRSRYLAGTDPYTDANAATAA